MRFRNVRIPFGAAMNGPYGRTRGICFRGPTEVDYQQIKFAKADELARRIQSEAGRAVAVQFACIEESPGSAEQDAG